MSNGEPAVTYSRFTGEVRMIETRVRVRNTWRDHEDYIAVSLAFGVPGMLFAILIGYYFGFEIGTIVFVSFVIVARIFFCCYL